MNTKHFDALDGLKGVAACIIAFAWHYQHFGVAGALSPFYKVMPVSFNHGYLMVEVFFMLSGFGLMAGYKDKIINNQISFKDFIVKRIQKLYPLHLFTLLLVTILEFLYLKKAGTTFVYPNFDLYHFFLNVLCLQNGFLGTEWSFNSPSWCISILLIMYCLFYYVINSIRTNTELIVKFAIGTIIGLSLLKAGINYPVFNSLIARGLSCFCIGVMLNHCLENIKAKNCATKIGVFTFLVSLGIYYLIRRKIQYVGDIQMLMAMVFSPLIITNALLFKPVKSILSTPPAIILGRISMHIYLLHFPVQCFIKNIDIYLGFGINYSSKTIWLLYIASVLAIATICFLCENKLRTVVKNYS